MIVEFGKIFKTRYLLLHLNDENYSQKILNILSISEARHSLARALFYGKSGELHNPIEKGQKFI
nr:transposase [Bacillus sp. JAS24-2]